MNQSVFEAQRLLRLASETNQQAAELAVQAINAMAQGNGSMTLTNAIYYINTALPGAALSEKEKEILKV